ncbi:MAG: hypothetical protein ACRDSN_24820 [Pseudonocardiaceae bacterium]
MSFDTDFVDIDDPDVSTDGSAATWRASTASACRLGATVSMAETAAVLEIPGLTDMTASATAFFLATDSGIVRSLELHAAHTGLPVSRWNA